MRCRNRRASKRGRSPPAPRIRRFARGFRPSGPGWPRRSTGRQNRPGTSRALPPGRRRPTRMPGTGAVQSMATGNSSGYLRAIGGIASFGALHLTTKLRGQSRLTAHRGDRGPCCLSIPGTLHGMRDFDRHKLFPAVLLLLSACDNSDDGNGPPDPEPPAGERGDLIGDATLTASYSPEELLAVATSGDVSLAILEEVLSPECSIHVYHFEYRTVDPAGDLTPASAALMVPDDSATECQGERPIVLYAHGTHTEVAFNMADLESPDNTESLLMAGIFAANGYIVIAPNYAGYDTSTLGYHPYLNGDQQSKDMVDALTAARSVLPTEDAPDTVDGGQLFVTGYSQGGYVAMATHRALQDAGDTVTASAPMSGPYALSAFSDAIFQGRVTGGSPVNLPLLITSYQKAYGDLYADTTEVYESQYATDIETLLPSTTSLGDLKDQGKLPDT